MYKTENLENHVLIGKTRDELESFAIQFGQKPFRGRQLYDWLYRQKIHNVNRMTNLPRLFKASLNTNSVIHPRSDNCVIIVRKWFSHSHKYNICNWIWTYFL